MESDAEFVEWMWSKHPIEWEWDQYKRLIALARRGAAAGEMLEALTDVTASLVAAHSVLERGGERLHWFGGGCAMTPAERRAALVERMLEVYALGSGLGILPNEEEDEDWHTDLVSGMSAALSLALEEAADVILDHHYMLNMGSPEEGPFTRDDRVCRETREQAAAAIRALKGETSK